MGFVLVDAVLRGPLQGSPTFTTMLALAYYADDETGDVDASDVKLARLASYFEAMPPDDFELFRIGAREFATDPERAAVELGSADLLAPPERRGEAARG